MDPNFELKDMEEVFSAIEIEDMGNAKRLHEKSKRLAVKFFTTLQQQQQNEQDNDGE